MSALPAPDVTPIGWVKGEIDRELALTRQCLEQFAFNPGDAEQLRLARGHLHPVTGAVKMLELPGLARFCEEIEAVAEALAAGGVRAEPPVFQLLGRALAAVSQFLEELLKEKPDLPLRLYPVYRELALTRGYGATEVDLFFPPLDVQPPRMEPRAAALADAGLLRGARTRFQRGLLNWLRGDQAGLSEMAEAVVTVEQAQDRPAERAFWWAVHAFFDALLHQGLAPELAVKQVCGKIDLQIRRLAEGGTGEPERLLREVLWQMAHGEPVTERVREVQQAYHLQELLPPLPGEVPAETGPARKAPILARMRELVASAKDTWVRCTTGTGSAQSLGQFREQVDGLRQTARDLENKPLAKLVNVVGGAAAEVCANPQRLDDRLAVELATALLLIEGALDQLHASPAEFPAQVEAMVTRVRQAALGEWDESSVPPLPKLDETTRRAQERQLIGQLAQEVQANLRQAEDMLDGFFRNRARHGDLSGLEHLLKQVDGSFTLLELTQAQRLLHGCQALIQRLTAPGHELERGEMELLAEGLSTLGFYMDALRTERPDRDARILEPILARLVAEPVVTAPPKEAAPPAPEAPPTDAELLNVFLEESGEVLQAILQGTGACRARPEDVDALAGIRRGFHTLKGSARMVGLTSLGEAAWELEQVLNRWLEERKPAAQELLDLVDAAYREFAGWIESLRQTGQAVVHAGPLIEQARGLGTPAIPGALLEPAMAVPGAAPEAVPVAPPTPELPEEVMVGSVTIPANLFAIFSAEARQHMEALRSEVRQLQQQREEPVHGEFMRAAHTLSGITRTVGFPSIAELAFSLEQMLKCSLDGTAPITGIEFVLIDRAVELLGQMLDSVLERRPPTDHACAAATELAQELDAELARSVELARELVLPGPPEEIAVSAAEAPTEAVLMAAPAPTRPAPEAPAEAGRERRAIRDDLDPRLLQLFLEEAGGLVPHMGAELRAWRAAPKDAEAAQHLLRSLHTLKGSARMAGAMRLGELTHTMESRIDAALQQGQVPETLLDDLEERFDRLLGAVDELQQRKVEAPPAPVAPPGPAPLRLAVPAAPAPRAAAPGPGAQIRVRAELVDRLVNTAGEVSIARSRIEAEAHALREALVELTENVMRLRGQLREIEIQAESQLQSRLSAVRDQEGAFDPLEFDRFTRFQELTRMMAESVNDVATVQQNLLKHLGDTEGALLQQARMNRELQQELMRVRAVPFSSYTEGFYRTVRQTARDLDRKARLVITGSETELDRGVMEKVSAPIGHLLRNAIAHGIEPPEIRLARGKPETGTVTLAVKQEGNEVSIALSDDGAGLDLGRIRDQARELGLLAPGHEVGDAQAMQYIFTPGFSTAEALTEVSGRGMGMDVVRSEITSLGGRVEVSSSEGRGTSFTLYLPLTLAVAHVVLVRAGPRTYAIPSSMVEQVRQVKPDELKALYETRRIDFRGQAYPFHYLPRLLGDNDSVPEAKRFSPVVLLKSGLQRVAVHIDELTSNQEVVVKNIGPQLSRVPGIEGATVLGNGRVVLIINPVHLASQSELLQVSLPPLLAKERPAPAAPVVMVVDDSLTVRKITGRLLAREGYQVMTAKDGLDALQQLAETLPDVMLVDIEMPRMDGFELTKHVRSEPRTAGLPIIMITSRTADKHRSYAKDLGVDVYLGKPYQEEELLAHIAGFLKRAKPAA